VPRHPPCLLRSRRGPAGIRSQTAGILTTQSCPMPYHASPAGVGRASARAHSRRESTRPSTPTLAPTKDRCALQQRRHAAAWSVVPRREFGRGCVAAWTALALPGARPATILVWWEGEGCACRCRPGQSGLGRLRYIYVHDPIKIQHMLFFRENALNFAFGCIDRNRGQIVIQNTTYV
jgi:hypothetical protein